MSGESPASMPEPAPDVRKVLRERARALSRPRSCGEAPPVLEALELQVAGERYAIDIRYVFDVYPLRDLTPLPCTPSFVPGIVNIRGRIVAVVDIKKFFDLPDAGLTDLHRIVLMRGNGLEFGLLADVVGGVRSIPLAAMQASLPTLTDIRSEYLKGVTADRLIVLDIERILRDPRLIVHEE